MTVVTSSFSEELAAGEIVTTVVPENQYGIQLNYATALPTNEQFVGRFREAVRMWAPRNRLIKLVREMIEGKNKIPVPKRGLYTPRITRSYLLAGSINEKRARFMNYPQISVIPDGIGVSHQENASELERAFNQAMMEIDRNGGSDTWDRVVTDALALDEGVELIERAPAAFWPELVVDDTTGRCKLEMIYQDQEAFKKAREEYKKIRGAPMRSVYVPLESFFPIWEGPNLVEAFHVEYRSLRSVLSNKLFRPEAKVNLASAYAVQQDGGMSTQIMIIRYANQWWYGYYAALPAHQVGRERQNVGEITLESVSNVTLLHAYEHGLGRLPYNVVPGRFGGWRNGRNGIEPVMNALCELNQAADILLSQVATNVGARAWPNLKFMLNPEFRTSNTPSAPKPPVIEDGVPLALYIGEDVAPIFRSEPDPMAQWLYAQIVRQFEQIAGSRTVYGGREPGVDSGYQHNLQITQSEHLDEKIEMNLSKAVIERCEIIASHIKAMGESVWFATEDVDRKHERKAIRYIQLKPDDLYPMPRMDARVRKPNPIDFLVALRAARDASADRYGPGTQLLSDETIYEQILNIEEPDAEMRKIWMQNIRHRLFTSDYVINRITDRLNMKFFEDAPPLNVSSQDVDPALIAAMQQGMQATAASGGLSPDVVNAVLGRDVQQNPANTIVPQMHQTPDDEGPRRQGGLPYGAPQNEQVIANAIRMGMRGGRMV